MLQKLYGRGKPMESQTEQKSHATPTPRSSPWGNIQTRREVAPGIIEVTTASHGGVLLAHSRLQEMPKNERTSDGWYEEDCEAAFVYKHFTANGTIETSDEERADIQRWCERWGPFSNIQMRGH